MIKNIYVRHISLFLAVTLFVQPVCIIGMKKGYMPLVYDQNYFNILPEEVIQYIVFQESDSVERAHLFSSLCKTSKMLRGVLRKLGPKFFTKIFVEYVEKNPNNYINNKCPLLEAVKSGDTWLLDTLIKSKVEFSCKTLKCRQLIFDEAEKKYLINNNDLFQRIMGLPHVHKVMLDFKRIVAYENVELADSLKNSECVFDVENQILGPENNTLDTMLACSPTPLIALLAIGWVNMMFYSSDCNSLNLQEKVLRNIVYSGAFLSSIIKVILWAKIGYSKVELSETASHDKRLAIAFNIAKTFKYWRFSENALMITCFLTFPFAYLDIMSPKMSQECEGYTPQVNGIVTGIIMGFVLFCLVMHRLWYSCSYNRTR